MVCAHRRGDDSSPAMKSLTVMFMCEICNRINKIKDGTNPHFVKELETGYVVLGDYQYFRGYTLFLCKEHKRELFELDENFRKKFMDEMILTAQAVYNAFDADKMNYECLGNGDAHLHWHLFPRVRGDIESNGPVWWLPKEEMWNAKYLPSDDELKQMKMKLLIELDKIIIGAEK